jgi:hypothetical protein
VGKSAISAIARQRDEMGWLFRRQGVGEGSPDQDFQMTGGLYDPA